MSIIVNHVSYIYNQGTVYEKKALDDVSFKVEAGEYIGIVGHTGSGKSTLVQHLNGLLAPTEGGIFFDGKDINDKDYSKKQLRSEVGLVFQYPEHQLFEADVFSDVCFGPKNLGLDKKEVELRAYNALKNVGFPDEQFYQSPFDISGGERRRVALAGVLAMNPRVLILDEPTAGLDPKGREEILDLIDNVRSKQQLTVMLVSHSMDDMAERVDRLLVMHNSKLAIDGSVRQVFSMKDELENMGLAVPAVTGILSELKSKGYPVRSDLLNVEEAASQIYALYQKRQGVAK